jgi:hypothetical protein
MKHYEITLTGKTPLLMHADNIEWADLMEAWKKDPSNKKGSKAGDDRSPAFRWLGSVYHDTKQFMLPTDNFLRAIMGGGAQVPTGRGQKTFKAQTQSGCLTPEAFWPLLVNGQPIPIAPFFEKKEEKSFDQFQTLAAEYGFSLFLKRAKIGNAKHIRVRPRLDNWSTRGELIVTDEQLDLGVLKNILHYTGQYQGLGDWRPGGKTPGPWGMFQSEIKVLAR